MRPDNRAPDELRPVSFQRNYLRDVEGAVLVAFGETKVLCTATVDNAVPPWMRDSGRGWVTAEYAMLPRSSKERIRRDANQRGRALEISRLIGRSLRAAVDLPKLGERQIIIDCDVIQADGGTRTAAITGGYVALSDALSFLVNRGVLETAPVIAPCAAVSVGIVEGEPRLDLAYAEDSVAEVDLNLVMLAGKELVEIQGSAESGTFSHDDLNAMVTLAERGIEQLLDLQQDALNLE